MPSVALSILQAIRLSLHARAVLQLEIVALRHQLHVLQRSLFFAVHKHNGRRALDDDRQRRYLFSAVDLSDLCQSLVKRLVQRYIVATHSAASDDWHHRQTPEPRLRTERNAANRVNRNLSWVTGTPFETRLDGKTFLAKE